MKNIQKVCVIGGGQMGRQIALNAAINGFDVRITDSIPDVCEGLHAWAEKYLSERIAKGKMTEEVRTAALTHFAVSDTLDDALSGADLVIEAIIEKREIKEKLFADVNRLVDKDTIIATNSSFMVSSVFADCIDNPSRLANLHYFNPALVMKLVEVVQGPHTSEDTVQALMEFAKSNGKKPIWVKREIEGFVANRIARAVGTEAMYIAEQGIATPVEIDTAVENGLNYPMGPFRLQDFTGIDIAFDTRKREYEKTGVKPIGYDLLAKKVETGELGRKTGKGWYDYNK